MKTISELNAIKAKFIDKIYPKNKGEKELLSDLQLVVYLQGLRQFLMRSLRL